MCGICGIINFNNRPINKNILEKMNKDIQHRGPDAEGYFLAKNIGLGHRRLSIIDLETGDEPIYNEDKTLSLIYNGEIYNYKKLRIELEAKGHIFKSNSDAETIVHLYEEYKYDCLKFLEGMFAFSIWDAKRKILFIARDRLGKKPVVYYQDNDHFAFSSELSSLLCAPFIKREVDLQAFNLYMSFRYVPSPWTMFKNVKKLPPAHYMIVKNKNVEVKRYWRLRHKINCKLTIKEYKEGILHHLEGAVKKRMISDVPIGAFLSGGLDSSAVISTMSKLSGNSVKTFSVGFKNNLYNELNFARLVAKKFNTDHKDIIITPDIIKILPKITKHYGEPFADYSCIPTFYLSEFASKFVKVVLTGDGGDESFAGYYRYTASEVADIFSFLPTMLIKMIIKFIDLAFSSEDIRKNSWQVKRFLKSLSYEPKERYLRWMSSFNKEEKQKIYQDEMIDQISSAFDQEVFDSYFEGKIGNNFSSLVNQAEIESYLPDDLLVKTDIATMAYSLEARSPFLDHKFMEFASTIPYDLKLHNFKNKYILKQSLKNNLPKQIIKRKKQGFGLPIGEWFRNSLSTYVKDILLDNRALKRGYFKRQYIEQILKQHLNDNIDNGYKIGTLLMLELWHQQFID